jgi:hypothetical protein
VLFGHTGDVDDDRAPAGAEEVFMKALDVIGHAADWRGITANVKNLHIAGFFPAHSESHREQHTGKLEYTKSRHARMKHPLTGWMT